jgi:hypothetical protein
MLYNLTKEELLEFAHMIYEQSVNGYLDLKEGTCHKLLVNFLTNKKTSIPDTNVNMSTNFVDTNQIFNSDVFTVTESFIINQTQ